MIELVTCEGVLALSGEIFFDLHGQVALITGGAQGIGEAICRRLAAAGARVAIFDLNREKALRVADDIGGLVCVGDVTNEGEVASAVNHVLRTWGQVTILVNNAGITGRAARSWELERQEWERVLAVNVIGPVLFAKAVVPEMLKQRYGRIVNVASVAGKEGNPTLGPYSASKAALIAWTKSLAKELVQQGDITVNAVSPAVIATPILEGLPQATIDYMVSRIPMGRMGKPEEVAAVVHFLVSREASFVTGQCYDVSGGRATY